MIGIELTTFFTILTKTMGSGNLGLNSVIRMFKLTRRLTIISLIVILLTFPVIVGAAEDSSPLPQVENEITETSESSLPSSVSIRSLLLRFVFNRSFEIPEGLKVVRGGGRPHLVAEKPRGWEALNPANSAYHFREGEIEDPIFECTLNSGGWQQEGMIRIDPTKTYQLGYWASYHDLLPGAVVIPASQIAIYNSQGGQITGIGRAPSFSGGENNWEQFSPLTIGPGSEFEWPENAALVKIGLFATGFAPSGDCEPGKIATVDFDDVSFRPQ
ncbi:MAG: hypothetical protein UU53_C0024G0008 [Candidatus Curtissbacteria bacterium GW2011_GWC2_41_21]|nr:MAG: hypothetical protein UU53_C0024G0008 [Candidatus Curtissbacteria bacterium GW2011_GWC2_41_21]